jgi:hypothetical protein
MFSTQRRIMMTEPRGVHWIHLQVWYPAGNVNYYQLDVFGRVEHAVGMKPLSNFVSLHPYFIRLRVKRIRLIRCNPRFSFSSKQLV